MNLVVPMDSIPAADTSRSASKINVLHLRSCRGSGGGPEKTILFSAKEVDQSAFNMQIAYLKSRHDPAFDLAERARAMGLNCFTTIEEDYKFDIRAIRALREIVRSNRIDILHCHCYKSDLYGLIVSKWHPMKLVTTAHGPLASLRHFWTAKNWRVRYLYDQLDLRLLRYFHRVIMVSDSMRPIIARHGVPESKLTWVRNAIDGEFFRRSESRRLAVRAELGIPSDGVLVGAVGRLNAEKDYPTFLRAAEILLRCERKYFFVIVGGGPLEQSLKNIAQSLGVTDRLIFYGHTKDVRGLYDAMDIYALSSTREGLPNTVLEAMAMEVPIVATDVDGVTEAVTDQQEAFIVPARDPGAIAQAVEMISAQPHVQGRLTRAARDKVEQQFSFATRMRKIESIYRSVMKLDNSNQVRKCNILAAQ
jgi:glycosyltransferase involved in cell wall biosynthesis